MGSPEGCGRKGRESWGHIYKYRWKYLEMSGGMGMSPKGEVEASPLVA